MSKRVAAGRENVYRPGSIATGRVSVIKSETIMNDFGGQIKYGPQPALKVTYIAKSDEKEHWDTVAQSSMLVPDEEGVGFELAAGADPKMANHGREMGPFIDALEDAGFTAHRKGDFSTLEGNDFNLVRVEIIDPKTGKVKLNKKNYPKTRIIFNEWFGETGEDEDKVEAGPALIAVIQDALKSQKQIVKGVLSGLVNRGISDTKARQEALGIIKNTTKMANIAKVGKFKFDSKTGAVSR